MTTGPVTCVGPLKWTSLMMMDVMRLFFVMGVTQVGFHSDLGFVCEYLAIESCAVVTLF